MNNACFKQITVDINMVDDSNFTSNQDIRTTSTNKLNDSRTDVVRYYKNSLESVRSKLVLCIREFKLGYCINISSTWMTSSCCIELHSLVL